MTTTRFEDRSWTSRDGLMLHYRDYPGPQAGDHAGRPPVLCLHGLTRNARDFERLAARLSPGWRVIVPDMRGRGDSEYARDSASYAPAQYLEDLEGLFEAAGIERFVGIGTSMGGLLLMLLALGSPQRLAGSVLNDVGPELEPEGLQRIRDYVGQGRSFPTWVHAARGLEQTQAPAHPGRDLSFWLGKAKQVMTVGGNGRIVFDYDMKIAEPFAQLDPAAQPDLWPALRALGAAGPALFLRGALSDLLSQATFERMAQACPGALAATVPGVGHAPDLVEPEAEAAIDRLLARVGA